jgi:uncharacterized protein YydD (DUF2326 family)
MITKNDLRAERTDVFSFWENVPTIENNAIIQVETKIEECTLVELEKRITDFEQQIVDLTDKIAIEKSKIDMINLL